MSLHCSRITGYTFQADNYCPFHLIETLISRGMASPAARDMEPEELLEQLQHAAGVNIEYPESFDSDEFPKAIWDYTPDRGVCGACGESL